MRCAIGGFAHAPCQLVHGRGGLLQRGRLLLGARRQVVRSLADLDRAGVDALCGLRNLGQRFADPGAHEVEVLLHLGKGGRQALETDREIAFCKRFQRLADLGDDGQALGFLRTEVAGKGNIHVEQGTFDQRADHLAQIVACKPRQRRTGDSLMDQLFEHHGIAADIPGRRKSDPGVHAADLLGLSEIILADLVREKLNPMVKLLVASMVHVLLRLEELGDLGRCGDLFVKIGQSLRRVLLQQFQYAWKALIVFTIDTEERKPVLICRCRVHGPIPIKLWGRISACVVNKTLNTV